MEEELQGMLESLTRLTEAGKVLSATNRKLVEEMMASARKLDYHPTGKQIMELCEQLLATAAPLQEADQLREARTVPVGSFEDIESRLRAALVKKYAKPGPNGMIERYSIWPVATYPDHVVIKGDEDGKLWDIPFTIDEAGNVKLGDPTEVVTTFQKVAEAVQIIEAVRDAEGKADGREWDVILIEAGQSRNGKYYPPEVLKAAVPLFEGVYAYADHATDAERAARPERSVKDKVGRYSGVSFGKFQVGDRLVEGLKARFKVIQPWLRETLKEAVDMNEPDFVGFSIDASGKISKKLHNGKMVEWVEAITRVSSVDVVTTPAAGGRVVRLVASEGRKEFDMDPEELKKLIEAAIGPVAAQTTELKEALAKLMEAKPVDDVAAVKEQLAAIQKTVKLQEAAGRVEGALREAAGLSEMGRERIRKEFAELTERREWTDEELKGRIKESVEYEAAVAGQFVKPGGTARFRAGDNSQDQMVKALDGLFDNRDQDGVARFRSLKEAYCRFTGADPFEMDAYEYASAFSTKYDSGRDHKRLKESLATADWASVFADAMYKKMMRAYAADSYTGWRRFVSEIESVPDFMNRKWVRTGGYADLSTVAEQGTYQPLTSPGDEEVNYQISKRGGLDDVTWEAIINDQVGAIRRIPQAMGRSAARTLFKFVMNLITTDNPLMDYDGAALYVAGHNNLDGNGLSVSAVNTGRQKMRDQTAAGEAAEILGTRNRPRYLIVPNELEALAFRIADPSDSYLASVSNGGTDVTLDPAMFKGKLEVVVYDQLTSATGWYLVGDPAEVETVVIGFLQGKEEPELFVQDQPQVGSVFTSDKVTYKVRHVYGGDVLDHRPFYQGNA